MLIRVIYYIVYHGIIRLSRAVFVILLSVKRGSACNSNRYVHDCECRKFMIASRSPTASSEVTRRGRGFIINIYKWIYFMIVVFIFL
jgi:hypothetical protein